MNNRLGHSSYEYMPAVMPAARPWAAIDCCSVEWVDLVQSDGRSEIRGQAMSTSGTAYLVGRRDDGFGDVFPLAGDQSLRLGRLPTCHIVLKDELVSREHAELMFRDGRWQIRDVGSRNGTRINGQVIKVERELMVRDEICVGRTKLIFVECMEQLGELPFVPRPSSDPDLDIRRRLCRGWWREDLLVGDDLSRVAGHPETLGFPRLVDHVLALMHRLRLDVRLGHGPSPMPLLEEVSRKLKLPDDGTSQDVLLCLQECIDVSITELLARRLEPTAVAGGWQGRVLVLAQNTEDFNCLGNEIKEFMELPSAANQPAMSHEVLASWFRRAVLTLVKLLEVIDESRLSVVGPPMIVK
jgi:hypothetical protein